MLKVLNTLPNNASQTIWEQDNYAQNITPGTMCFQPALIPCQLAGFNSQNLRKMHLIILMVEHWVSHQFLKSHSV